ncbi:RNA 2',3'-cyclic phosphodiesterase [Streptomyces sp. CMB-StM0423]|uniref:RNA 2',3'-cyclic phosphodiesterase n=1 Tax=Streptomyces sp. CMB-StM0423 TaxID=2059884 RepID=UPI000C70F0DE|nr:RNA 2',3'-cyclic phosphodiesterase [Streptomyces sp. CMB-StM0423]AUH45047.1 RNA 2',3'-cyclic phosphodiesterase [Streptomyces sp. CMB-StM0423]
MKLFAAVIPPAEVLGELAEAVARLRRLPGAGRLRWVPPEGWHLTVAFYGQVPAGSVAELEERLARAARRRGPVGLRLAGGGRFSDTVLWAGAAGDVEELGRLAASTAAAGHRTAGVPLAAQQGGGGGPRRPERRYRPHLTLARQRHRAGTDLTPFTYALRDFTTPRRDLTTLTLIRSHPPPPGHPGAQPHYEPVATWPLGGGGT